MRKIFCLFLVLLISSCAMPSKKEGMVVTDYDSPKKIGHGIYVKESIGGSITLPFWVSKIPNDNFTAAVKESLLISNTFSKLTDNWDEDWALQIEIIEVKQPFIGSDYTVRTNVRYSLFLKDKKVYETSIIEYGTVTIGESLYGAERLRLANEKSAKANIRRFLKELSKQKFK